AASEMVCEHPYHWRGKSWRMKLHRASAICFAIFAVAACKHSEEPRRQAQELGNAIGGQAKPTPPAAAPSADPWSAQKPAQKDPLPHPLFWAVEKDGKTTYFLGTMHAGVDPA